jgi:hypothetical protein
LEWERYTNLNPATGDWATLQKAVTALNRYGYVDDIAAGPTMAENSPLMGKH